MDPFSSQESEPLYSRSIRLSNLRHTVQFPADALKTDVRELIHDASSTSTFKSKSIDKNTSNVHKIFFTLGQDFMHKKGIH